MKGSSGALFGSSMRHSSPGRSTRKQRQADGGGGRGGRSPRSYLEIQLRVPNSFPLEKGLGAGGEKRTSITAPPRAPFSVTNSLGMWLGDRGRRRFHWCQRRGSDRKGSRAKQPRETGRSVEVELMSARASFSRPAYCKGRLLLIWS